MCIRDRNNYHRNVANIDGISSGIDIAAGIGSSSTFQLILLKSKKELRMKKVVFTSETVSEQENFQDVLHMKQSLLSDACFLPFGIPGMCDAVAVVDEVGEVHLRNFKKSRLQTKTTLIGSLRDENAKSHWACLRASPSGDFLYGASRKRVKMFDLRSRPKYDGGHTNLFSILKDDTKRMNYEMIGGITNCSNTSTRVDLHGGKIYLCTNLRMIALDQRMPGRVCAQMMLYPNPSYSSKVAVPSGLAFCSTYTETNVDPSRLDYVAAWWPYSNSNTANAPAAILGCFEQSYSYCSCHLPFMADRIPPLKFGEDCLNGDHSRIERAPTVVRGMPLRIAGPLTSVDFSNQPCIDRLSLPWAGLVMTKLGTDAKSNNCPLSIFCLLYTSPRPRDATLSRMPSSA